VVRPWQSVVNFLQMLVQLIRVYLLTLLLVLVGELIIEVVLVVSDLLNFIKHFVNLILYLRRIHIGLDLRDSFHLVQFGL